MVGGTIIEAKLMKAHGSGRDVLRLWCVDQRNGDECAVYAEPYIGQNVNLPEVGDEIWWQGGTIYWSDRERTFVDSPIPKIGFSFDPRETSAPSRHLQGGG